MRIPAYFLGVIVSVISVALPLTRVEAADPTDGRWFAHQNGINYARLDVNHTSGILSWCGSQDCGGTARITFSNSDCTEPSAWVTDIRGCVTTLIGTVDGVDPQIKNIYLRETVYFSIFPNDTGMMLFMNSGVVTHSIYFDAQAGTMPANSTPSSAAALIVTPLGPGSVNVRSTPDISGAVVAQISPGESADFIDATTMMSNAGPPWYHVSYGGQFGWVRSDLVDTPHAR